MDDKGKLGAHGFSFTQTVKTIKVPDEQSELTYFDKYGKLVNVPNPNYPPRVTKEIESAQSAISTGMSIKG
jgi:hypothetical protein